MKKTSKLVVVALASLAYFAVLHYVAPVDAPCFVLGIALIGLVARLYGTLAGILCAMLNTAVTQYLYSRSGMTSDCLPLLRSPSYIIVELLAAASLGRVRSRFMSFSKNDVHLKTANQHLQTVLADVKELGGIHSLCTSCKKIKGDSGEWMHIETYLQKKTKADFSHGICPQCAKALYGDQLGDDYNYSEPQTSPK